MPSDDDASSIETSQLLGAKILTACSQRDVQVQTWAIAYIAGMMCDRDDEASVKTNRSMSRYLCS